MRRAAAKLVLLLSSFSLLAAVVGVLPSAASTVHPALVVSPLTAAPSSTVHVTGSGFLHSHLYQLQICGDDDAQGSVDCDQGSAVMAETTATGTMDASLTVAVPPAPCPCVLAALAVGQESLVTTPLTIPGTSSAPTIAQPQQGKLVVRGARLLGGTQPGEWLGMGADRTLEVTVQNVGSVSMQPITLIASIGATPAMLPNLPGLAPGEIHTYSLAVAFPALSVGHTELTGRIGVMGEQFATFRVGISFYPWAIPVLAIVVGQGLLLLIRNLLRRRIRRRQRRAAAAGRRVAPPPGGATPPGEGRSAPALAGPPEPPA